MNKSFCSGKKFNRFSKCVKEYCHESTIHGLRNIAADNRGWLERCFWMLIFISCTLMVWIMVSGVWKRFQESPTMTIIESNNHPIKDVPFPAITVCNLNKILSSSAKLMMDKLESEGIGREDSEAFLKEIPQIYTLNVKRLKNEDKILEAIEKLGYNIETFMFELSQPCSKQLVRCLWLGKDYNCSSMFVDLKTPDGFCCTFHWFGPRFEGYPDLDIRKDFNAQEIVDFGKFQETSTYYISQSSTSLSGLTVIINSQLEEFFSSVDSFFGSVILLHDPLQYPDVFVPRAAVQPRFETALRLRSNIMESSPDVRSLKIHQRQCYFEDEVSLKSQELYSYDTCNWECKLEAYNKICGCVPFFYPNLLNIRTCTLPDMRCLYKYRDNLSTYGPPLAQEGWTKGVEVGTQCRCLPVCNDWTYDWIAQGNKIYYPQFASPIFEKQLKNKSVFHVFFEDNVCTKYRTESMTKWDNVIASFGGIFGLCLGGSIVSIVEFFYYWLYEYWKVEHRRSEKISAVKEEESEKQISVVLSRFNPIDFHLGKPYYDNKALPWIN